MLLTLSTSHAPAGDLGYLLHKNPARGVQSFSTSVGEARVFFPEASEARCTAALMLEVDPVALVRGRGGPTLDQYVNDRPYAASSLLSSAISQVFRSAMNGTCVQRAEAAAASMPLTARIASICCGSEGEALIRRLFEPLGYAVGIETAPPDPAFGPGEHANVYALTLEATTRLSVLLTHLYVLLPVLDNDKHYFVGEEEVEKLLRHGEGWLSDHPEKALISARYLKHRRRLVDDALLRLSMEEPPASEDPSEEPEPEAGADVSTDPAAPPAPTEPVLTLHQQRHAAVIGALRALNARTILDLGCGEGRLIAALLKDTSFTRIVGVEVSSHIIRRAADRLRLDTMPRLIRQRVDLIHGSLLYRDERLTGFDAAAVVEVIEHLDEPRLAAFERVLFECARPGAAIITTPNREYNVKWETLAAGTMRHHDHRFEWTREQFTQWCARIAARFGYTFETRAIGEEDPEVGAPSQMAIFKRWA